MRRWGNRRAVVNEASALKVSEVTADIPNIGNVCC